MAICHQRAVRQNGAFPLIQTVFQYRSEIIPDERFAAGQREDTPGRHLIDYMLDLSQRHLVINAEFVILVAHWTTGIAAVGNLNLHE